MLFQKLKEEIRGTLGSSPFLPCCSPAALLPCSPAAPSIMACHKSKKLGIPPEGILLLKLISTPHIQPGCHVRNNADGQKQQVIQARCTACVFPRCTIAAPPMKTVAFQSMQSTTKLCCFPPIACSYPAHVPANQYGYL